MEAKNPTRIVGIFVLVALVLIGGLVINFSKGASIFTPGYNIVVKAQSVGGLKLGAAVTMSGVPIGSVKSIQLSPDGKSVLITCRIEKRYAIYEDARFEIEQSGFLGDQFVSIEPQQNQGKPLADGREIQARSPFNLQEAARSAVALMQHLDNAASKIEIAVDRVEQQLLSADSIANLTATVASARRVSERAEAAVGQVQELVKTSGPAIGGSISNFNAFSAKLSDLADRLTVVSSNANSVIQNVDGVIVANRASLQATLNNLQATTEQFKLITADLQAGRGAAGALLKDDHMSAQLNQILINVNTVSSNLARFGLLHKPKDSLPRSPLERSAYPGKSGLR